MNPTPETIAAIRQRVTDWEQDNSTIVAVLNAVEVENPDPAPMVPVFLSKQATFALLTNQQSRLNLLNFPNLKLVFDSFDVQDHESAVQWVQALALVELITVEEASAVIAYIQTPVPDPDWPTAVAEPLTYAGRTLDMDDVQEARP